MKKWFEVNATKSKIPPPNIIVRAETVPPVLCPQGAPSPLCPQAALPTPAILPLLCSPPNPDLAAPVALTAKKLRVGTINNDEVLNVLNEERKQVILHKNNTNNARTNDCVRYLDIGNEKQGRDVSKAENRSKKKSPKAAQSARAQEGKKARTTSLSSSSNRLAC
jgi:hypothetical protein